MNKAQWSEFKERLHNPKIILAIVFAMGLLINMLLFLNRINPHLQEQLKADSVYRQLDARKKTLEKSPIPAKVSTTDIDTLLKQVPTSDETSIFLISLKDMEKKTGVTITAFSLNLAEKGKDELTALMGQVAPQAASNSPAPATSPKPSSGDGGQQSLENQQNALVGGFVEDKMNLKITGTYTQFMDFLNRLYLQERVVNILEYNFQTLDNVQPQNVDPVKQITTPSKPLEVKSLTEQTQLQVSITLSVYSAAKYAGKVKGPPTTLPIKSLEQHRQDPTLPDDLFLKQLENMSGSKPAQK